MYWKIKIFSLLSGLLLWKIKFRVFTRIPYLNDVCYVLWVTLNLKTVCCLWKELIFKKVLQVGHKNKRFRLLQLFLRTWFSKQVTFWLPFSWCPTRRLPRTPGVSWCLVVCGQLFSHLPDVCAQIFLDVLYTCRSIFISYSTTVLD